MTGRRVGPTQLGPGLQIPGYSPPTAAEVTAQQLGTLIQQNSFTHTMLECVLRALLGQTKQEIEETTGLRLMTKEEMDALRAGAEGNVVADLSVVEGDGAGGADSGAADGPEAG